MTKIEYKRCVDVMRYGIKVGIQAKNDFEKYEENKENENGENVLLRCADQHFGDASGVYYALTALGFKHEDMEELSKLVGN